MPTKNRGFTLIELMVVVSIIAIIAAIAYPSYQEQVRRTRRSDAKAALMDAAQQMERCYTQRNTYENCITLPFDSQEDFYQVLGKAERNTFALIAKPQGAQASDTYCGDFTYNHAGTKGVSVSDHAEDCW